MKERPILFNAEMVRAIFDGRKTQTRRVVSDKILDKANDGFILDGEWHLWCPYGKVGDRLWVRETWQTDAEQRGLAYRSTDSKLNEDIPWKPSIHMPRWASRLTLEITDIRVERVQDISEEDAKAEGAKMMPWFVPYGCKDEGEHKYVDGLEAMIKNHKAIYRNGFATLWGSINASRGYSWTTNPWVWVVVFKVIDA
jgi:hypothetical protein